MQYCSNSLWASFHTLPQHCAQLSRCEDLEGKQISANDSRRNKRMRMNRLPPMARLPPGQRSSAARNSPIARRQAQCQVWQVTVNRPASLVYPSLRRDESVTTRNGFELRYAPIHGSAVMACAGRLCLKAHSAPGWGMGCRWSEVQILSPRPELPKTVSHLGWPFLLSGDWQKTDFVSRSDKFRRHRCSFGFLLTGGGGITSIGFRR
jgi:hypothetical protein